MTCRMAAGQQKKRMTSSNLQEQNRPKKKPKFDSSDCLITLKSHVDLRWDDSQKRVLPKKEQVGISWSDLAPFIESSRKHHSGLADVISVPREIFTLENLKEVLSYEVWGTCLTEDERIFLAQFLPSGTDGEEIVRLLLTGANHHFGNPSLKWSTSLCCGNLHPDVILRKEQKVRASQKAYRVDLNNYHFGMVEILKKWKERWLSCDDPENFFRDNTAKQMQANLHSPGENMIFHKASKKEVPLKVVRNGDVAKYMSYIKVSRTQHDLVKSMKQSGDGIQPKHLTRVIGNMDNFPVKPYEALMDEDNKRLHEHWLLLSCKDIPAAFELRRDRKVLIEKLRKSLGLELAEMNISVVGKAEYVAYTAEEIRDHGACENGRGPDVKEEVVECSPQHALQGGDNHSLALEDQDFKDLSHTDMRVRHQDCPDLEDQDLTCTDDTNTATQSHNSSDVQGQDFKDISYVNTSIHSDNSLDVQDQDLKDISYNTTIHSRSSPDVQVQDVKAISYVNTAIYNHSSPVMQAQEAQDHKAINYASTSIHNHNSPVMQAQDHKAINYASTSIHKHNSPNVQDQEIEDVQYAGTSICGNGSSDEQEHDLENIRYRSTFTHGHNLKNQSVNSHPERSPIIVEEEEAESIAVISNSSSLLSKSSGEQIHAGVLELKDPAAKCENNIWQSAGPLDSYYCPPENSMYTQSGDLSCEHPHLSGGHQSSVIDLEREIIVQQQPQVSLACAFPMANAASLLRPCSNRQHSEPHQTLAKNVGLVSSYSLEHVNDLKQPIDLQTIANNRLSQSAQFPNLFQEQKQLLDQRQNGLFVPQPGKNLYSVVKFPSERTFSAVEQQNFGARAPVDNSCNWFADEHQPHSNWSGMELDGGGGQGLPGGGSADGSLFSVLSQYNRASSRMQFGMSSSGQYFDTRNLAHPAQNLVSRSQNLVPPAPNVYGYSQNPPNNQGSHASSADASLNNMQWTNFTQHNNGMPDSMNRQFRGPWSR